MPTHDKTRVLIAPLDWGLGHATRCIPIIQELLKADFEVIVGAHGRTKTLLEGEFPSLNFISLEGYNIRYGRTSFELFIKILFQIPKILSAIRQEQKWLHRVIKEQKIDIVISDNRYGLYNKGIYSIFIIHQLRIRASPFSNLLQRLNYKYINNFDVCWVPDDNKEGLAGSLSHPKRLPSTMVKYIGHLSRFQFDSKQKKEKHLLILLSGPEPQRSILERELLSQLKGHKYPVILVRGLPGNNEALNDVPKNVTLFAHLDTNALQDLIQEASFVISRCGYSTIMDLVRMKKKSILIPTPGQTEQEYLAQHLLKNHIAFTVSQKAFDLSKALSLAQSFPYKMNDYGDSGLLENVISELGSLKGN
jgi:uncharacterized protein (TIGR00661 family)